MFVVCVDMLRTWPMIVTFSFCKLDYERERRERRSEYL
jgi:hypothetical protein